MPHLICILRIYQLGRINMNTCDWSANILPDSQKLTDWLTDWLTDQLKDWPTDWLHWLTGNRLIDLAGGKIYSIIITDFFFCFSFDWPTAWLTDLPTGHLTTYRVTATFLGFGHLAQNCAQLQICIACTPYSLCVSCAYYFKRKRHVLLLAYYTHQIWLCPYLLKHCVKLCDVLPIKLYIQLDCWIETLLVACLVTAQQILSELWLCVAMLFGGCNEKSGYLQVKYLFMELRIAITAAKKNV